MPTSYKFLFGWLDDSKQVLGTMDGTTQTK